MGRPLACALSLALLATPALAQEAAPVSPASPGSTPPSSEPALPADLARDNDWVIRIDPRIWWVSPAGDLSLPSTGPSSGDTVELKTLNLDTPEFTPAGSVSVNAGDFRFSFFGAAYERDADGVATAAFQIGDTLFADGDPFESQFELNLFELTAAYRFLSRDFKNHTQNQDKAIDLTLDLYALVGGRFFDTDIRVAPPGAAGTDSDQFFGDVIAGLRAELSILRDFSINLQLTGGGMGDSDRSSISYDIQVSGEWRPWNNVGFQVGWRHLGFTHEDGDGAGKYELDGSVAGVFAGIVVRF